MSFDEFDQKLNKMMAEFRRTKGKDMKTIQELRSFLDKRLLKPKKRGLRSLRGLLT